MASTQSYLGISELRGFENRFLVAFTSREAVQQVVQGCKTALAALGLLRIAMLWYPVHHSVLSITAS